MNTRLEAIAFCAATSVAIAATAAAEPSGHKHGARTVPLEAASMIIEYNASDEDVGVQFFVDSEGWREIEITDPSGREIFSAESEGRLTHQGGGTELFLESVEPAIEDLPLEKFFRRFPAGTYRFHGLDRMGNRLSGAARFSHDVPAGPTIVRPMPARGEECADNVPVRGSEVAWNPVNTSIDGGPIKVLRYEVIVENEEDGTSFDVKLPAAQGTMLSLPMELLQPGTSYTGEVLAVAAGGNQTITTFCFTTAG